MGFSKLTSEMKRVPVPVDPRLLEPAPAAAGAGAATTTTADTTPAPAPTTQAGHDPHPSAKPKPHPNPNPNPNPKRPRATPAIEREHVHAVYDNISEHWSQTRYKPWPRVVEFIKNLRADAVVLDVGTGNGKYLPPLAGSCAYVLGCDTSVPLLEHAQARSAAKGTSNATDVCAADCVGLLPVRDALADAVLCIAVLHHISTEDRRLLALREMTRVLRPGGVALLYVWAFEQDDVKTGARKFPAQDCFVPWTHRTRGKSYKGQEQGDFVLQRYCHCYRRGEIEALLERHLSDQVVVKASYFDQGNWCCVFERL